MTPVMAPAMSPRTIHDSDGMTNSGCEASRTRVTERHASVEWTDRLPVHIGAVGAQAHRVHRDGRLYYLGGSALGEGRAAHAIRPRSCTPLFTLEHSKAAYRVDFAVLGGASIGLGVLLLCVSPRARLLETVACATLGLASWTFMEYGVHRFVLHGVSPFSTWHAQHHRRPAARIYSPTFVSVASIAALIYLPTWIVLGTWPACALTFGVTLGDFAYSVTHHAVHHWAARGRWLGRRKRWHALHHAQPLDVAGGPGYYGVTSMFWDHVLRTALAPSAQGTPRAGRPARTVDI